jgi:hypothetical protein
MLLLKGEDYEYIPVIEDGTYWSYAFVRQTIPVNYTDYRIYHLQGDTVIEGLNYKKLLTGCPSGDYLAGLREADQKIFIKEDGRDERLLYDFNLQEGDWADELHRVTKVDTVPAGGTMRRRLIFDDGYETWFEGIGSIHDFFPLQGSLLGYELQGINYQKKGGEIVYKTNECYFNANDCSTNGISSIDPDFFTVRQSDQMLYVSFETPFSGRLVLYDILGKIRFSMDVFNKNNLSVPVSEKGCFVLFLSNIDRKTIRKKILFR